MQGKPRLSLVSHAIEERTLHIHVLLCDPRLVQRLPWPIGLEEQVANALGISTPIPWHRINGGHVPIRSDDGSWYRWMFNVQQKMGFEIGRAQDEAHGFVHRQSRFWPLQRVDRNSIERERVHLYLSIPHHTLVHLGSGAAGYQGICQGGEWLRLNISPAAFRTPEDAARGWSVLQEWERLWNPCETTDNERRSAA